MKGRGWGEGSEKHEENTSVPCCPVPEYQQVAYVLSHTPILPPRPAADPNPDTGEKFWLPVVEELTFRTVIPINFIFFLKHSGRRRTAIQ